MGEFLDKVLKRKAAPEALAHRVALSISAGGRALIVEAGDDVFFYNAVLRRDKSHVRVELFAGDGRRSVIDALQLLDDLGKKSSTFGIVDRDLNLDDGNLLLDGRCLVLDVYSYEMYFASKEVLVDVGKHIFALEVNTDYIAWWETLVDGLIETVPEMMVEEMGLAYWARENQKPCSLNNFNICGHIDIGMDGRVGRKVNFREAFIARTACPAEECSEAALAAATKRLASEPWQRVTRGHYFWEIVTAIAEMFRIRLDDALRQIRGNRSRTRHQLSGRHLLDAATSVLQPPSKISEFFRDNVLA